MKRFGSASAHGGLGRVEQQDVSGTPTQTLRDVMALAADRDLIARQYANDFAEVWNDGVPALMQGSEQTQALEGKDRLPGLTLLAKHPDSLRSQREDAVSCGSCGRASNRAAAVLAAGWPNVRDGWKAFSAFDTWLRAEGHQRNPGTTADLLTACLFILLREDTIRVPLEIPWPAGFPS